jgi:hypothetical protein
VIIHAYNQHVRLLSPEPLVVDKPSLLGSKEPALLCNQVDPLAHLTRRSGCWRTKMGSRIISFRDDWPSASTLILRRP